MPRRPPSPCTWPGYPRCPELVENGSRCPAHRPKPWAGTDRARLPADWARLRQRVLRRDGHRCTRCGAPANQVDHVTPHAEGGTDDLDNLAAICDPCHKAKTQAEANRGRRRRRNA